MGYIAMQELLKDNQDSIYKIVTLASRRALELGTGSEKLVDAPANAKITTIAFEEIKENKISYKIKSKT